MAKTLTTNVVINGKANGFESVAETLQATAQAIAELSNSAQEFLVNSTQTYQAYEDNMLETKGVLMASGYSANEMAKVMRGLEQAAADWASTSIFHVDDVSGAILQAAKAGWDYEEIMSGIPVAMRLAQAGAMTLTDGLDDLIKMTKSAGVEMEEMPELVDQWVWAANSSATSVAEMGEAWKALGSNSLLADNTAEIFTMLSILANSGTTAQNAGTAIRGVMLRLISPVKNAAEAMEQFGMNTDELEEYKESVKDKEFLKAYMMLQGKGFTVFDDAGKMKPMLQIFREMGDIAQDVYGEDYMKTEGFNTLFNKIFPTRTNAAARALLNATGTGMMDELYNGIMEGSEGYSQNVSELMMSGLTGAIETLKSKWEEFERSVGEMISPYIIDAAEALGGIMDALNGMDAPLLGALTGALGALAAAGPITAGAAAVTGLIDKLGLGGTLALVGVTAIGAAVGYLKTASEIEYKSNFGQMALDIQALAENAASAETSYDALVETLSGKKEKLSEAEEDYAEASDALSENLMMALLTGREITKAEKDKILGLGTEIKQSLMEGIAASKAGDMTLLEAIFAQPDITGGIGEETYGAASQVMESWYSGLMEEARSLGEQLRQQMVSALSDDTLSAAEREAIRATQNRYNQMMAEIAGGDDRTAYYEQLYKAQTLSWDTYDEYVQENAAGMEERLSQLDDRYAGAKARMRSAYEWAEANGTEFTDEKGNKYTVNGLSANDPRALNAVIARLEADRVAKRQEITDLYGGLTMTAFDELMYGSDYSNAYKAVKAVLGLIGEGEDVTDITDVEWDEIFGGANGDIKNIVNELSELGGADAHRLREHLKAYRDNAQAKAMYDTLGNDWMMSYILRKGSSFAEYGPSEPATTETQDPLAGLNEKIGQANESIAKTQEDLNNLEVPELEAVLTLDDSALTGYKPPEIVVPVTLSVNEGNSLAGIDRKRGGVSGGGALYLAKDVNALFAEGGRATQASIFAEDGAEWAIPEEHSARTAALLNAARAASGFTWGDILGRFGGLNGNAESRGVVLHYAPVINATDARGVADILEQDKERLSRMLKKAMMEAEMKAEIEAWA